MKNLVLIFAFMPLMGIAQIKSKNTYTISGVVGDYTQAVDQTIYLRFKQNDKEILDSTKINKGKYSFMGEIAYPTKATLQIKVTDSIENYHRQTRVLKNYAHEFYLDKGKLIANAPEKLNSTVVKGSSADDNRQELKALLAPYYKLNNELYNQKGRKAYENKDTAAIAIYSKESSALQAQIDAIKKDYLFAHPKAGTVLELLSDYTRTLLEPAEIEPFFNKIQPELKNSPEGLTYAARIEKAKATASGVIAPNFTLKDRQGKEISLSDIKGKIILLDFWGSWCSPCRQTHPHLRELYAEYKNKGFEIFGVANERGNPEEHYKKWTSALDQDQMTWVNVLSETKKDQASVASTYSINAYPTKILIDRNGKILKKFVGSGKEKADELDQLLKQLMPN